MERPRGKMICHNCYGPNHISPECVVHPSISESTRILQNYEALTEDDKHCVPATSYWKIRELDEIVNARARAPQDADNEKENAIDGEKPTGPNPEN